MKYYETSKFPRFIGSTGFFSVIAICLIALGAVSWFAVSRFNSKIEEPQSSVESPAEETPSYLDESEPENISSEEEITSSIITENSVESVPYIEEKPERQEITFVAPVKGNILKDYSDTALQYSKTYGDMRLHTGTDILCKAGSEIKAMAKGTVTALEDNSVLGKCLVIDHGNGITVKYCGFDTVSVNESETVSTGMVIGTVGTVPSECADESHIHIEVKKDGKIVSPLKALGLE